jgi:hypothetical protein
MMTVQASKRPAAEVDGNESSDQRKIKIPRADQKRESNSQAYSEQMAKGANDAGRTGQACNRCKVSEGERGSFRVAEADKCGIDSFERSGVINGQKGVCNASSRGWSA